MGLKQIKLVKPKSIALNIASFNEIQSYIDDTYKDVSEKSRLKYLSSFILFVCCIIEEAYQPRNLQNKKVDKKEEVMKHIEAFFEAKKRNELLVILLKTYTAVEELSVYHLLTKPYLPLEVFFFFFENGLVRNWYVFSK